MTHFPQLQSFYFSSACWAPDPHSRPNFKEILNRLETISRSHFADTPHASFGEMQTVWKKEISQILDQLKRKEKALRSREEELSRALTRQKIQDEVLRQREKEIKEREFELLER